MRSEAQYENPNQWKISIGCGHLFDDFNMLRVFAFFCVYTQHTYSLVNCNNSCIVVNFVRLGVNEPKMEYKRTCRNIYTHTAVAERGWREREHKTQWTANRHTSGQNFKYFIVIFSCVPLIKQTTKSVGFSFTSLLVLAAFTTLLFSLAIPICLLRLKLFYFSRKFACLFLLQVDFFPL